MCVLLDASKALEKDGKKIYPEKGASKKGKRIRVVESSQREMQRAIDEIVHGPDVARLVILTRVLTCYNLFEHVITQW